MSTGRIRLIAGAVIVAIMIVAIVIVLLCVPSPGPDTKSESTSVSLGDPLVGISNLNVLRVGLQLSDSTKRWSHNEKGKERWYAQMAYIANGVGELSVDLSSLNVGGNTNPVKTTENGVEIWDIYLPEPKVTTKRLDFSQDGRRNNVLDFYFVKKSIWRRVSDDEVANARAEMEQECRRKTTLAIQDTMEQREYMDFAKQQAELVIRGMFAPLGIETIRFHWGESSPSAQK